MVYKTFNGIQSSYSLMFLIFFEFILSWCLIILFSSSYFSYKFQKEWYINILTFYVYYWFISQLALDYNLYCLALPNFIVCFFCFIFIQFYLLLTIALRRHFTVSIFFISFYHFFTSIHHVFTFLHHFFYSLSPFFLPPVRDFFSFYLPSDFFYFLSPSFLFLFRGFFYFPSEVFFTFTQNFFISFQIFFTSFHLFFTSLQGFFLLSYTHECIFVNHLDSMPKYRYCSVEMYTDYIHTDLAKHSESWEQPNKRS